MRNPLTQIMISKAAENEVPREDIVSKRDSLLDAYSRLIEAQRYREPPRNVGAYLAGTKALAASDNPIHRMAGAGMSGFAEGDLGEFNKRNQSELDQVKTLLQGKATDLGFSDSDRELQYKYLTGAANSDYKDEMTRLKELMIAQKMSEDGDSSSGASTSDPSTLGVPAYKGADPYAGMDKVGKRQARQLFEKKVEKAQDASTEYQAAIDKMKRFQQLNEEAKNNIIGTGPIADYVPTFSEGLQEMDSIASELIPQMRVPGSGSSSDFDAKMFTKATVGTSKDYDVNKNIADAYIISKQNQMAKADFLETYLTAHGHLRGAEQQWKKYLNDNPVFSPKAANSKKFEINPDRKDWQTYFGASPSGDDAPAGEKGGEVELIPEGIDKSLWGHLAPEEKDVILRKRGMK